jgi:hypothetical protein
MACLGSVQWFYDTSSNTRMILTMLPPMTKRRPGEAAFDLTWHCLLYAYIFVEHWPISCHISVIGFGLDCRLYALGLGQSWIVRIFLEDSSGSGYGKISKMACLTGGGLEGNGRNGPKWRFISEIMGEMDWTGIDLSWNPWFKKFFVDFQAKLWSVQKSSK